MFRRLTLLLPLAALTGLLTWWTLAEPESASDPASLLTAEARPALSRLVAWYRGGPADGRPDWKAASLDVPGGDARLGPGIMAAHGCGTCHVIPGVTRAHGTVGPSLEGFAARAYVAGVLSNRPGELIDWLMDPVAFAPQTAMPDLELSEAEARHIAAYLYGLRR